MVVVVFGEGGGRALGSGFALVHHLSGTVFPHELGHLMGSTHDRYEESICSYCGAEDRRLDLRGRSRPFPYGFGYVNQAAFEPGAPPGSRWRTIMAYDTQCTHAGSRCRQLMRFSNADQTYSPSPDLPGDPLGVPGNKPSSSIAGPADNRRVFNETRRSVANDRVTPCLPAGAQVRLQVSNGQYVLAVNNGGGEVLADGSKAAPWAHFTMVDANGGCVEHGDTVSLHTSDGFYLRAAGGGGSTLDASAPRATPWARFTARRAPPGGQGAVRSGDSVTFETRTGHYVCAEDGGGGAVRADCASAGVWGEFKITRVQ